MIELVRPPHLRRGDRVAVVTPSFGGPAAYPRRYAMGKRVIEERFGLDVIEMPHTFADDTWLKRNPQARADDLMRAFADGSIRAVIATIGGDDSLRVLPHLDLSVITNNPKIFLGYSDATSVHFACMKAGATSFYGPTVIAGFAENVEPFAYTLDAVERMLFSTEPSGLIEPNRDGWTDEFLAWSEPSNDLRRRRLQPSTGPRLLQGTGTARGPLIGGCAEILEMLKGTPWWPPLDAWRGAILFYEMSEEAPEPKVVTRWLRNFAAQGILQVLSGILIGRPAGVDVSRHTEYDAAVIRALDEAGLVDVPVMSNMDFGHTDPIMTLPYGVVVELDCAPTSSTLIESGVS